MGHAASNTNRVLDPAQVYLVTLLTAERHPWFDDFETARCVARVGSGREVWRDGRLLAWVLMPDQWQGLVQVGALDSLATAVGRLKSMTSRAVRRVRPETTRLWDTSFQDRALRPDEDVTAAARHLVGNPLRAGLVQRIGEYTFWDAVWV